MLNAFYKQLANYLATIQRVNTRQVFVPVVLVFALLFSFISHGNHYDLGAGDLTNNESSISAEQDCHLCHNNIDNVDNSVEIIQQLVSRFLAYSSTISEQSSHSNYVITPPLRAPPVQL